MGQSADLSYYVQHLDGGVERLDLAVDGITCATCIPLIEDGLAREPGVTRARLNLTSKRLAVEWMGSALDPARIVEILRRLGFHAHPFDPHAVESAEKEEADHLLRCLGVAAFATMNVMLLSVSVWSGNATDITPETRDFFHWLSALIAVPTVIYSGRPFFVSAWRALKSGQLNMDVPIALGVTLATGMSIVETLHHATHAYFDSAVMLLFFLLVGRYLDQMMRRKTQAVAANLAALKAETAVKIIDGDGTVEVPIAAIKAGDLVLVRAGDRVSVDGVVEDGRSRIDQSIVTGETVPVSVGAGMQVYAGTVNLDGALRIRVQTAHRGTLIDEVNRLVETAFETREGRVRLADRAARLYSPVVHVTALATFLGWIAFGMAWQPALIIAITVLIITCPCALGLAIPAVQVVAAGALFRAKVLLNSGDAIERMAEADTVVFDKTGTLTLPSPVLVNSGAIEPRILALAGSLAVASRHPMAAALAEAAGRPDLLARTEEVPGAGMKAVIDGIEVRLGSASFCGAESEVADASLAFPQASLIAFRYGEVVQVFALSQGLRPDAKDTIEALKAIGLRVLILSGDRPEIVAETARALGVDESQGGLDPIGKIDRLKALQASGAKVLMVGDGLNDAPALAAAYVSLSPITAIHLAQAASDAVFLGESLKPVREAITLSRRARGLMTSNLWLAVIYNLIAVPIAIAGWVTPLVAALAMSGSSVLVTVNALRARSAPGAQMSTAIPKPALPVRMRGVSATS